MFKKLVLIVICIISVSFAVQAQEMIYSFDMGDAQGRWMHTQLEGRDVISTDKQDNIATVFIDVPEAGHYQLMVSLYHRWRKYCPFLYFEITDSKGRRFSDYTFSESRGYLKPGVGRWEYRSPSASPFWYLALGKAKVKFWVEAKNDCWKGEDVPMEGKIFIEKLVLIPIDLESMTQLSIKDKNKIRSKGEL